MKILFVGTAIVFNVATPEQEPLGGSESCMCYLARQLARGGHAMTLLARLPDDTPRDLLGVRHISAEIEDEASFFAAENFDVVVVLNNPDLAPHLKASNPKAFNVAWLQMFSDQPAMASLPQTQAALDCVVFVSDAQRASFPRSAASYVIGNGIAPAFENLFGSEAELLDAKRNRAVYTSTPFRGLDVLVEAMERTKADTTLDIYSSMQTYQLGDDDYTALYERARRNPRVHYHGAVAQNILAERLKSAAFLAYPSTYAETYCIAALEAMAAGLKVVSTDFGALPETTMGYADLLPINNRRMTAEDLVSGYTTLLEKNVSDFLEQPEAWAERMFEQIRTVNRFCTWQVRAAEWEAFLATAVARKRMRAR